ncbi:alpha/beta fold hydrolase [Henriciella mobilis]|uniref:Alpha/beta fold hydrolase n=1 Tax=Henriciella mobilis TaxID=2305467 RepID=A0A399RDY2_9PROT|nr:alpha/beta fold hydrolase [Henriciella mobilis]RIJ28105.1 alpha/beta fold hydrolase [Henriciella mobilis]
MTDAEITEKAEALLAEMRPFAPSAAPGQNFLPPETRRTIPGEFADIPVWRAGDGPDTTLFIHGWDDSHRVWRQFAMRFLQTGRPILLMDLPGHGAASKAEHCSWPYAGAAVREVIEAEGPVETIIAHSFGCKAAARAVETGAEVDTLILIAPPLDNRERGWASRQRKQGVDDAIIEKAQALYKTQTGVEMEGQDFRGALARFRGRILLVGSEADEGCPLQDIRALAESLPNADLVEDYELGHRELALDPGILSSITHFLGH